MNTWPGAYTLEPIKSVLFDHAKAKIVTDHGLKVEDVFAKLFEHLLNALGRENGDALTQSWASVSLTLVLALPSGLSTRAQSPVLTGLYRAGKEWLEKLGNVRAEPLIAVLPESEAAMLGILNDPDRDLSTISEVVVFDAGGTTVVSIRRVVASANVL